MPRKLKIETADPGLLLLEQATQMVTKNGAKALTARTLAAACKVAPGTIYNYYRDRDTLLLAVNSRTLDELTLKLKEIAKTPQVDGDRALLMATGFYEFMLSHDNLWESVINYRFMGEVPSSYQDKVLGLVALVTAQLRPDDPAKIDKALLLWASIQGLWLLSSRNKLSLLKDASPKRLLKLLWDLFAKS